MKIKTLLIVAGLSILAIGCGEKPEPEVPEVVEEVVKEPEIVFDITEYKTKALDIATITYDNSQTLVNIANYEVNLINTHADWGRVKTIKDEDREKGCQFYKTSMDEMKQKDDSIKSLYKEFILIDTDDSKEATEIENLVRSLYDNYCTLYSTVLETGTSLDSIAQPTLTSGKAIIEIVDNIKLFCEE